MELARWRFLSKLLPGYLTPVPSERHVDRRSVDDFLGALRDLALGDTTRLPEYAAKAPRLFPPVKSDGYSEHGVRLFLHDLDAAVFEYVTEMSMPHSGGPLVVSQAELRRQAEIARAQFLNRVQPPGFARARGGRRGYDPKAVGDYLNSVRELAFHGMTRLLAYIATTPFAFRTVLRNGYDQVSVIQFMDRIGHAARECMEKMLVIYGDHPSRRQ